MRQAPVLTSRGSSARMRVGHIESMSGGIANVRPSVGPGFAHILRSLSVSTKSVLAVLLFAGIVSALVPLGHEGKVYPGVQIAGIAVGGLTEAAALDHVHRRTETLAEQIVALNADGRTWTPRRADLGITYDSQQSVGAAMAYGRNAGITSEFQNARSRAEESVTVPLSVRFDADQFNAYLDQIEGEQGTRPLDAAVTIDGTDVLITHAQDGWTIDRNALQTMVLDQIATLQPLTVSVPVQSQAAAVTTENATATKTVIDRALAEPFILMLSDQQWTIAPEQLAGAVRTVPDGSGALAITLDAATLDTVVATIAVDIDAEAKDAWVQDLGTHQWLVPSQQGRTLDREELSKALETAFVQGEHMIDLVVTEDQSPTVTTEALMVELGITDLIASGDSMFAGSGAGRAQNVTQAAYMIDGTLVPPGGIFSFNDAVGSLFSGEFTDAGSYIDGPSGQSLAGGVCQVSTTVYRAALEAGLPIVEWWPHSYRSPFYETGGWSPGYDASIVQDLNVPEASTDFRFENTTDSWLLVRAVASEDGNLRVELHGSPPGYTVEFDEPIIELIEQAPGSVDVVADPALPPGTVLPDQPAMDGLRVTVVRHVFDATGQEISTNTFVSSYRAYGAVRRVSPDME